MKKLIFVLLSVAMLFGCSQKPDEETGEKHKSESGKAEEKVPESSPPSYVSNPQVTDDRSLKVKGQSFSDEKGELVLKEYKKLNEKISSGPITMKITEAKQMTYRPDYSLTDFFHSYTHEDKFDFIKLSVEVNNSSNETLFFAPAASVKTDSAETKSWEEDIYLEELNGQIRKNEAKKGNLGFIVEKTEIQSFKVTTSEVLNEKKQAISPQLVISIDF
ncbi:membrane lipoprotein lipid attachment site-containing protein [Mesobacillus zeae]|uniref:DUF4352 domain-containing protein n=1 Tax=Mesobacillus zeae TaxID=1917180 RepID=A0A398B7F1_9BACI|nr:membrane lipoprotein lipid attachment site-containing protein [Mesobacillus zeae]RID85727.1 DUF4352 domain-containing protein [Mesobacillus zeae]